MINGIFSPSIVCRWQNYLVALLLLTSPLQAADFIDDFNNGNISGWTTYNPLGNFSTTFPNVGKAQLQSGISPNPATFGPGRGSIYRNDLPQVLDHAVSAQFSNYDDSNQFFGVIARMRQIGPGTLDAYVLSYSPQWYTNAPHARFALDRLDNEQRTELMEFRFNELGSAGTYQLQIILQGNQLTGVLTDVLNPTTPLSTITATDNSFTQGLAGLFVAGSLVNNTTTLVNFDNFTIQAIPEPSTWAILIATGCMMIAFNRKSGRGIL